MQAQNYSLHKIYEKLEVKDNKAEFAYGQDPKIDSIRHTLDSVLHSTGNPIENLSFQFLDDKIGFAYGNESGYGVWPFLFKTENGGQSWQRQLIAPKEYGPQLGKQTFYMFDKKNGILLYNHDNTSRTLSGKYKVDFEYYITNNGGETWRKKSISLKKAGNLRVENSAYFLQCAYQPTGQATINILAAPWQAAKGKRSIQDRIRLILQSEDYGRHFDISYIRARINN